MIVATEIAMVVVRFVCDGCGRGKQLPPADHGSRWPSLPDGWRWRRKRLFCGGC